MPNEQAGTMTVSVFFTDSNNVQTIRDVTQFSYAKQLKSYVFNLPGKTVVIPYNVVKFIMMEQEVVNADNNAQ